jgi:hypothetical protein
VAGRRLHSGTGRSCQTIFNGASHCCRVQVGSSDTLTRAAFLDDEESSKKQPPRRLDAA